MYQCSQEYIYNSQDTEKTKVLLIDEWIKMWYIYTHNGLLVMKMNEILPFPTMCMDLGCCGQRNSRQGLKVVNTQFGKKELETELRFLKMGPGDSRRLGSRALLLRAISLLFSVLASRKYLLCYNEVSLLCPRSHLPFY